MKFALFYHSVVSCWNHGNAHFLRGVCRELIARGHEVSVYEPLDGWSRANALEDGGVFALKGAEKLVPALQIHPYWPETLDLDAALDEADVVIVHEWNAPELVAAIGARRAAGGRFTLLFHDTHHRAVSAPHEIGRFEIDGYDGVLAFGEVLREVYLARGWASQVFTWHEAADTALFRPVPGQKTSMDLVWIGNWGDGERSAELHEFLVEPVSRLGLNARIHGVRYPADIREQLAARGIDYAGWLPNHNAPAAFASALFTVHVPRRPYVEMLPGIPTIRVFEALACGIPLVSAPWHDAEALFPEGCYLTARDGEAMIAALARLRRDPDLRNLLIRNGLATIEARHSCTVRVEELLSIVEKLQGRTGTPPRKLRTTGEKRLEMAS
jgi:spore maturation protein CgeB